MPNIVYLFASRIDTIEVEKEVRMKKKGKPAKMVTRLVEEQVTVPTWTEPKPDPNTGLMHPSHDSAMVEAEVLRIVKDGVQLLTRQSLKTVSDTGDADLLAVYKALTTGDRTEVVTIRKGIHQRETRPHITVRLVGEKTLHIWISADSTDARFAWTAVAVSANEGALIPPCVIQGVRRRGSVELDVLTAARLVASLAQPAQLAS